MQTDCWLLSLTVLLMASSGRAGRRERTRRERRRRRHSWSLARTPGALFTSSRQTRQTIR